MVGVAGVAGVVVTGPVVGFLPLAGVVVVVVVLLLLLLLLLLRLAGVGVAAGAGVSQVPKLGLLFSSSSLIVLFSRVNPPLPSDEG